MDHFVRQKTYRLFIPWRRRFGQSSNLSDISGWSLSLVGSPPRRPATERPARAACWPPSPIPVSRMPDRGDDGAGAGRAAARPQIEPPRSGVAAPVGGSVKMTLGVSAVLSL